MRARATWPTPANINPSLCRLIITGDFIESTRQRLEEGPYRDNHGLNRNTGVVGGRTMQLPDASIDVRLPDFLFELDKTPEQSDAASRIALHTVLHEGEHVAMTQAGETDPDLSHLDDETWNWSRTRLFRSTGLSARSTTRPALP